MSSCETKQRRLACLIAFEAIALIGLLIALFMRIGD
jgi:hypothetical protein